MKLVIAVHPVDLTAHQYSKLISIMNKYLYTFSEIIKHTLLMTAGLTIIMFFSQTNPVIVVYVCRGILQTGTANGSFSIPLMLPICQKGK